MCLCVCVCPRTGASAHIPARQHPYRKSGNRRKKRRREYEPRRRRIACTWVCVYREGCFSCAVRRSATHCVCVRVCARVCDCGMCASRLAACFLFPRRNMLMHACTHRHTCTLTHRHTTHTRTHTHAGAHINIHTSIPPSLPFNNSGPAGALVRNQDQPQQRHQVRQGRSELLWCVCVGLCLRVGLRAGVDVPVPARGCGCAFARVCAS